MLHSWAITIGALAAAAPVIIHLLTRPKPLRFPFSTVRFVKELIEQRKARNRLDRHVCDLLRLLLAFLHRRAHDRGKGHLSHGQNERVEVLWIELAHHRVDMKNRNVFGAKPDNGYFDSCRFVFGRHGPYRTP